MISNEQPCPDDLVMRGHRNELSQIESRTLNAHLAQCADCRASLAAAALFDAIPDAQPGDKDLVALVAARATKRRRSPRTTHWLQQAVVASVLALGAGVAAATWLGLERRSLSLDPSPSVAPLHDRAPRRIRRPQENAVESPHAALQESPQGSLEGPPTAAPPQKPSLPPRSVASFHLEAPAPSLPAAVAEIPERNAASLFAEANTVRRAGDLRRAISLYQALRREFPTSSQALLAAVSAADLQLGLGEPAAALAAYEAYLTRSPGGALTEEALFGRARCLGRLGHTSAERRAWEELVLHYPRSAYRPSADRRLQELDR